MDTQRSEIADHCDDEATKDPIQISSGSQSCVTRRPQIDPAVDKLKMTQIMAPERTELSELLSDGDCAMNLADRDYITFHIDAYAYY